MSFRCIFFALVFIPYAVFSQPILKSKKSPDAKVSVKKAANYYLKKRHNPSPGYSIYYSSLFSGLQKYTKKDSLLANKVISRLYQFNDILFFRLMRIRLEWEFKQHLNKSPLDSLLSLCKNNIDSANYSFILGIYFEDCLYERIACKYGYVRALYDESEVVDWRKVRTFRFYDSKIWEQICIDKLILPIIDTVNSSRPFLANTAIKYYAKSYELNNSAFYYIKELLIFLAKLGEEDEIQKIILSNMKNSTSKQKRWFKKCLKTSYKRKIGLGNHTTYYELYNYS